MFPSFLRQTKPAAMAKLATLAVICHYFCILTPSADNMLQCAKDTMFPMPSSRRRKDITFGPPRRDTTIHAETLHTSATAKETFPREVLRGEMAQVFPLETLVAQENILTRYQELNRHTRVIWILII